MAVFGDVTASKLATVGINPSNREFVDGHGEELLGSCRRFHTLQTLAIARWEDATNAHLNAISDSCATYFRGNPYSTWFDVLDRIIAPSGYTFYGPTANACHLDLVPYATSTKWTNLSSAERSSLINISRDTLATMIAESALNVLVLNGRTVVEAFQSFASLDFECEPMRSWTLPRQDGGVKGFAYRARLTELCGLTLTRPLLVLGYNHNLQSSFGVTNKVKQEIAKWIAAEIAGDE